MELWTIQLGKWRIAEAMGIELIDTTIKTGQRYWWLNPTWDIVMGHKEGRITDDQYTETYKKILASSYFHERDRWEAFLTKPKIALACYCAAGKFCHRHVLASCLERLIARTYPHLTFEGKGELLVMPTPSQSVLPGLSTT